MFCEMKLGLQVMTYTSEKLLMMDRGTVRNMQFYSKNKSEKSVHLFGFIIRIYHDAWSPECQILHSGQKSARQFTKQKLIPSMT